VTLSKVSIAKLVWIGPIPLQISCDFLLQFGAIRQANSKRQLSAEADCLDSRPQLFLILDPVSFEPCVVGLANTSAPGAVLLAASLAAPAWSRAALDSIFATV
jgi:hypothetical protein